jgi:outer membrane lipoprotein-sorting protein
MKRILLFTTAAAALAFSLLPIAPATAAPATLQVLSPVLLKMEQAGRNLKTLRAGISRLKRDTTLGATDKASGTLYYKAGSEGTERVLIEDTEPMRQIMAVVGDKVTIYQPRINQAFVTTRKAAAGKNRALAFLGIGYGQAGAQLRDKYDVTVVGPDTVAGRETTLLALKPKQQDGPVMGLQVWVDNTTWLPVQYVIGEKGARTTVTLSSMQPNVKLDDNKFEVSLPKGTQIVEG